MMIQDCASSNKIKENKYKILRMSLLLGSDDNREETLNNFEDAAREIDAMNDEIYIKDLENKFYDTLKLEEEEKKLTVLVDYIGGRVEQRISLLSDFANVTGFDLTNLPPIKYYDKLDDYKERLKYIREYLDNTNQINELNHELEELEENLKKAYLSKATSEECNGRNEEMLLEKFLSIIKGKDEFKDVDEVNIDSKLNEVIAQVQESKKSLDIFTKSLTTLSGSGISYEEEQEYLSYVNNAKDIYYINKEEEYLLKVYKLLLKKETDYSSIIIKREEINNLLYERLNLRKELNIEEVDILSKLYDQLDKQYEDIKKQKDNINDIDFLNESIESKKSQVGELEQANQKVEILALLREFCIIDTYNEPDSTMEEVKKEINKEETNVESNAENTLKEESIFEKSSEVVSTKKEESTPLENPGKDDVSPPINNQDIFTIPLPEQEKNIQEEVKHEEVKEENPKDNQVTLVEDAKNIDLELMHSKADKVMQRVGEMLGIKSLDTQIVSVSNEKSDSSQHEDDVTNKKEASTVIPENPLFNNDISNVEKQEEVNVETQQGVDNNFWFSSDSPDALNELPDLSIANNSFFPNDVPDLNFPDLKINFDNNDSEEK